MRALLSLGWAIAALAAAGPAAAGPSAAGSGAAIPCMQAGATTFASFGALPGPASLLLLRKFAPGTPDSQLAGLVRTLIGARDAPWQATDVVSPGARLPGRRFMLGDLAGARLRVWYESGGIAHMYHVTVLDPVGGYGWRITRHLAAGSPTALCQRLTGKGVSVYDQYW